MAHTVIFVVYFRITYLVTHPWYMAGTVAGIAIFGIGLTSLPSIRLALYEYFYLIHIVGFVVRIPAIILHYPTAQQYAVVAGLSVLYDRATKVLLSHRTYNGTIKASGDETVLLTIPIVQGTSFHCPVHWRPGQHLYLTVIGCHTYESHPYTIAS